MNYKLCRLEFPNGVHFGKGNLDSTEFTFHADTLFSALFQEALKIGKEKEFLQDVSGGKIVFTDAFPFIGKCYYVPKPMLAPEITDEKKQGDSREKKMFKNLKYIPVETVHGFIKGTFPREHMEDMKYLGKHGMKVSVRIQGVEESQPYRVSSFHFHEGTGLYIIAGYEEETALHLWEELLNSLQYRGLGGKKSSGYGRFICEFCDIPTEMEKQLKKNTGKKMLLSTALPEEEKLDSVLQNASYILLKRSGFVDSENYAPQQMRKRELYVFSAGSCFDAVFEGRVIEERNGGTHPVFRYAKAFFMGVS